MFVTTEMHGLPVLVCENCFVIHQSLQITEKQYEDYYKVDYDAKHHAKDRYDHDREISEIRFKAYDRLFPKNGKILDVGCNNGAFVDVALDKGYDAYGNELNQNIINPRTYAGYLKDLKLPDESFDAITLHDVLEHFVDPVANLKEIHRILTKDGILIVDFPHFYVSTGLHHWKLTEHLWLLDKRELIELLLRSGFSVIKEYEPIPSKIVVICKKV